MIAYVLNFVKVLFLIYKIKESIKILSFILLQNLVLTIFMVENTHPLVAVDTRRISTSTLSL